MQQPLKLTDRLIVAADFKPSPRIGLYGSGRYGVRDKVLTLADKLYGTGVYLKVNSALRACGYDLIGEIHARGLKVFADLKLFDIPETLATDGELLREARPGLLTVAAAAGEKGMSALKAALPETEVLAVTVLTTFSEADSQLMFTASTEEAVARLARLAAAASVDGFIAAPLEAPLLRSEFGVALSINTPAIRPVWAKVPGDDQNPDRVMTPYKAIKAGADRIVVGRPIVNADEPEVAVERTLAEIASAL